MLSDCLVSCDCGFQSSCPMMEKDKRLMEAFWWERLTKKNSLVLMGGAMLGISLIQFSVDEWSCVPSLLFTCAKEIPHVQGQRNHSKMVGGANSGSESNPIPARDTQRAQTNLGCTRTQRPTETETELCLSVSCGGTGQQWTATGAGALGVADSGMA